MNDPIIYGRGTTERIVAVDGEPLDDDESVIVYRRLPDDTVTHERKRVWPMLFLRDAADLERPGFRTGDVTVRELAGEHPYRFLVLFSNRRDYFRTRGALRRAEADFYVPESSIETQYLLQSGETLFKGMVFDDLHRLQLDIETYSDGGFPNANIFEHKIIIVSISDNRGYEAALSLRDYQVQDGRSVQDTEKLLLLDAARMIRFLDPDVIELHNGFGFDLPYIDTRCKLHDITFNIGRQGEPMKLDAYPRRKRVAERMLEYRPVQVPGRHVVDTYFAVADHDIFKRDMQGYSLKESAKYFNVVPDDRTYIPGDKISETWDEDPDTLLAYALDDVRETEGIAKVLLQQAFYTVQMVPLSFDLYLRAGTGIKSEVLIVREYLRQSHSLPNPEPARRYVGAYTDLYHVGVFGPIAYADVASLYPSIMLNFDVKPGSDTLNVFPHVLQKLTDLRFEWKAKMKTYAEGTTGYKMYEGMQKSAKIAINGLYGYLGYAHGIFNDYDEAERVTLTGQNILKWMIHIIGEAGGKVIEVDTDGVMFVPPAGMTMDEAKDFVRQMTERMPKGIVIDFDGWAESMLSYKKKNYALIERKDDGSTKFKLKGGALVSRRVEQFGIELSKAIIKALLAGNIKAVHDAYHETRTALVEGRMPVEKLASRGSITESIETYTRKVEAGERNRDAAYELALQRWEATGQKPKQGERLRFYVCDRETRISYIKAFSHSKLVEDFDPDKPDYSVKWYLKRLKAFISGTNGKGKFKKFFTDDDFAALFGEDRLTEEQLAEIKIRNSKIKDPETYIWPNHV